MQNGANIWSIALYFGIFIAIFYLLVILPRKKQEKKHKELVESLSKGQKIVTIGGIKGEIIRIKENTVILKISENTEVEFLKTAMAYREDEVK